MQKKNVVALTGGIGSGKSTVAHLFHKQEVAIIECDLIAHRLTAPQGSAMPLLQAEFGHHVITPEGALNRTKMRHLILKDTSIRHKLESILHPLVRQEMQQNIKNIVTAQKYILAVIPSLLEGGGLHDFSCFNLVVDCSESAQIRRTIKRGGLSHKEVKCFLDAQLSRTKRNKLADGVIDNDEGTTTLQLTSKVHQWHAHFNTLFSTFS